jgi:hypothetical protein
LLIELSFHILYFSVVNFVIRLFQIKKKIEENYEGHVIVKGRKDKRTKIKINRGHSLSCTSSSLPSSSASLQWLWWWWGNVKVKEKNEEICKLKILIFILILLHKNLRCGDETQIYEIFYSNANTKKYIFICILL